MQAATSGYKSHSASNQKPGHTRQNFHRNGTQKDDDVDAAPGITFPDPEQGVRLSFREAGRLELLAKEPGFRTESGSQTIQNSVQLLLGCRRILLVLMDQQDTFGNRRLSHRDRRDCDGKQQDCRRSPQDARLILKLMLKDDFLKIWVPRWENRNLPGQLRWHRLPTVRSRIPSYWVVTPPSDKEFELMTMITAAIERCMGRTEF